MEDATITGFAITHSEQVDQLFAALANAQGEMEHAAKDTKNDFFKSRYADLASAVSAARPHLAKNGLAVLQLPAIVNGGDVALTTILGHKSGQYYQGVLTMRPVDFKAQTIGSTITYARRYSYMAITGLAADDDDGNAASGRIPPQQEQRQQQQEMKQAVNQGNVTVIGDHKIPRKEAAVPPVTAEPAKLTRDQYQARVNDLAAKFNTDPNKFVAVLTGFYKGWFGADTLPKDPDAYVAPLDHVAGILADASKIAAFLTGPKAYGESVHTIAKANSESDMAGYVEAYMVAHKKTLAETMDHLKAVGLDPANDSECIAYLRLATKTNSAKLAIMGAASHKTTVAEFVSKVEAKLGKLLADAPQSEIEVALTTLATGN